MAACGIVNVYKSDVGLVILPQCPGRVSDPVIKQNDGTYQLTVPPVQPDYRDTNRVRLCHEIAKRVVGRVGPSLMSALDMLL